MKIKFHSDDELPVNTMIEIPSGISKREAMHLMENIDLTQKSGTL